MEKLRLLIAFAAVSLWGGRVGAQTDVTSTYIANPSFELSEVVNTGNVANANLPTGSCADYTSTGWTAQNPATPDGCAGVFVYGSSQTLNGFTPPATAPTGGGKQALGVNAGLGQYPTYETAYDVTLPAGTYTLSADVYNANGTENTTGGSCLGFTTAAGAVPTTYKSTQTNFASNTWTTDQVTFTLAQATKGRFVVGMRGNASATSLNTAALFYDNIKLMYTAPTNDDWVEVTTLPSATEMATNYYIIYDANDANLMLGAAAGVHQNTREWSLGIWYQTAVSRSDIYTNTDKVWILTLGQNGAGYSMANYASPTLYFQTEWNAAYKWNTNDVGTPNDWSTFTLNYVDNSYWTIEQSKYTGNYLGAWDGITAGNLTAGNECAGNKTGDYIGRYKIYAISRKAFNENKGLWPSDSALESATDESPVDVTSLIFNPSLDDNDDVGWVLEGSGGNIGFSNGAREIWHRTNFDFYQGVGVPPGRYKATMQASGSNTAQLYLKNLTTEVTVNATEANGANFAATATAMSDDRTWARIETPVINVTQGDLILGYKDTDNNMWDVFDDFHLYYLGLPDLTAYASTLSSLVAEAEDMYATLPSAAQTALQTVVDANKSGNITESEYEEAIANISVAMGEARKQQMDLNAANVAATQTALAAMRFNDLKRFQEELSKIDAGTEKTNLEAAINNAAASYTSASEYDLASQAIYNAAIAALPMQNADINVSPLFMPNFSFESGDLTYWENNTLNDTGVKTGNAGGIYGTANIDGTYLFNTWGGNADKYIQRTVTGLPEGTYRLVFSASSDANNTITATLGAFSANTTLTQGGSTFEDVSSPIVSVANGGSLLVKANNNTWYKADNFRLMMVMDELEHYTYVANQANWASCDAARIEQANITYDTANGTISLVPSTTADNGLHNVSLNLYEGYYIEPAEKYFYVKASNTLAEHSKNYHWWLGGQLLGDTEPTQTARDDDYTYYIWDLTGKAGYKADTRSTLSAPSYTYSVVFGLTQEDTSAPSVIHDIEFLTEANIPAVFQQWEDAKEALANMIANANTVRARMQDASGDFSASIATAQAVYANPESTLSQFRAQLAAVKAAFNTALLSETSPVEVTEMTIINPSFEYDEAATNAPTGWTPASTAGDTGVKPNSNNTYRTANVDGAWLWNTFDGAGVGYGISQTLTGLTHGNYKVQAKLCGLVDNTLTLSAGAETTDLVVTSTNVFSQVKTDMATVNDGTLAIGVTSAAGWYKADDFQLFWYPENTETPATAGTTPYTGTALTTDGGTYFLFNPAADAFLCGGNDWGTRVSVNDVGIPVTLIRQTNGTYRLSTAATYANRFIGLDRDQAFTYVDTDDAYPNNIQWTVTPDADDPTQVTLKWDESYLTWDGISSTSKAELVYGAPTAASYWQLVTKAERLSKVGTGANNSYPAYDNASFMFINPDFSVNANVQGWNTTTDNAGNTGAIGGRVENYCQEFFDVNFTTQQEVANATLGRLPAGLYRVEMQGFYRDGALTANAYDNISYTEGMTTILSSFNAPRRRHRGAEALRVRMFATVTPDGGTAATYELPLRSIFGDSIGVGGLEAPEWWTKDQNYVTTLCGGTGPDYIFNYGFVPNTMNHASDFFSAGFYGDNRFYLSVPANSSLTVGVKKDEKNDRDWTGFDHVRLYYVGPQEAADFANAYNAYQKEKQHSLTVLNNDYTLRLDRDVQYLQRKYGDSRTDLGMQILKEELCDTIYKQEVAMATLLAKSKNGTATVAEYSNMAAMLNGFASALDIECERVATKYAIGEFYDFFKGVEKLSQQNCKEGTTDVLTKKQRVIDAVALAESIIAEANDLYNDPDCTLSDLRQIMRDIYGTDWKRFDMDGTGVDAVDAVNVPDQAARKNYNYTPTGVGIGGDAHNYTDDGLEPYMRRLVLDYVAAATPAQNNVFDLTCLFKKPRLRGVETWSIPVQYGWKTDVDSDGNLDANGRYTYPTMDVGTNNNFNIHFGNQIYQGITPSFAERYYGNKISEGWAIYQEFLLVPGRYRFVAYPFAASTGAEPGTLATRPANNGYLSVARSDNADRSTYAKRYIQEGHFSDMSVMFNVPEGGDYKFGIVIDGNDATDDIDGDPATDDRALWVGLTHLQLYKIPDAVIAEDYTYAPGVLPENGRINTSDTKDSYFDIASEAELYMYRTFPAYKQNVSDWEAAAAANGFTVTKVMDTTDPTKVARVRITDASGNTSGTAYETALANFNNYYENYWSTFAAPFNMSTEELKFVFGDNATVNWFTGSEVTLFDPAQDPRTDENGDFGAQVTLNFTDPIADGTIDPITEDPVVKTNRPVLLMVGVDPDDLPYDGADALNGKVGKWFNETNITDKRVTTYGLGGTPASLVADKKPYYLGTVRPENFTRASVGTYEGETGLVSSDPAGVAFNPDGGDFAFVGVYNGNGTYTDNANNQSIWHDPTDATDAGPWYVIPEPDKTDTDAMTASYYVSNHVKGDNTQLMDQAHFRYVGEGVTQKMFGLRGFFRYTGSDENVASGNIRMNMMSGTTTAVYELRPDGSMEKVNSDVKTGVYNVQGQLISKDTSVLKTLPKGVYIVNGKKVMVK